MILELAAVMSINLSGLSTYSCEDKRHQHKTEEVEPPSPNRGSGRRE